MFPSLNLNSHRTKKLTIKPQIGTWENPLYILAWRKLEPACTWDDVLMRMANVRSRPINGNVLSMRISRMMDDYMVIFTWRGTKDWIHPTRDQARRLNKLDEEALQKNSTRRFTPGLCYPELGEAGGRVPVPVDHRKRSRGSYSRKTFTRKAARASRAVTTPSGAAKKRKAAVKGPKAKNPRSVLKLPVRDDLKTAKRSKTEHDSDEDDVADDGMIEDEMYEDDVGEDDVDEDPSSWYEDEDANASADEETVFSTPEKRVKIESSPLAHLASTQSTPSYPFTRLVDGYNSEQFDARLNYASNHPYELSYAVHHDEEVKHIDPRNIYEPNLSFMPHFSASQPVDAFDYGRNTTAKENPFQVAYPTPRRERDNVVARGLYLTGLNFVPGFTPTVPSNDFSFRAVDPSLPMNTFTRGHNNLTVNNLPHEDAPHDQANEFDYAHDTYWFPKR